MPFATNDGTRVHYEVTGDGPDLVLYHGFSHDLQQWRYLGFVEALKASYRLIMVDGRGHGASDKPREASAYDLRLLAGDVVAVLDHAGVARARYYGYSMGGYVGFGLARFAQERFHSLVIGGMHPFPRDPQRYEAQIARLEQGMDAWVANVDANGGFRFEEDREIVRANDPLALIAFSRAMMLDPELESHLDEIRLPLLLVAGEDDPYYEPARQCAPRIAGARFVSYTGKDHQGALNRDLNMPDLEPFLAGTPPSLPRVPPH